MLFACCLMTGSATYNCYYVHAVWCIISAWAWAHVFSIIAAGAVKSHSHFELQVLTLTIVSSASPASFHAPLFLLMFLRCVGTLNFNGLLMFGCKLQSAEAWSGLVFMVLHLLFPSHLLERLDKAPLSRVLCFSFLAPTATWWWDSQHDWVNIIKKRLSLEIAAARFKQAGTTAPEDSRAVKFGQTFVWIKE